jgi:hypothetical protein
MWDFRHCLLRQWQIREGGVEATAINGGVQGGLSGVEMEGSEIFFCVYTVASTPRFANDFKRCFAALHDVRR